MLVAPNFRSSRGGTQRGERDVRDVHHDGSAGAALVVLSKAGERSIDGSGERRPSAGARLRLLGATLRALACRSIGAVPAGDSASAGRANQPVETVRMQRIAEERAGRRELPFRQAARTVPDRDPGPHTRKPNHHRPSRGYPSTRATTAPPPSGRSTLCSAGGARPRTGQCGAQGAAGARRNRHGVMRRAAALALACAALHAVRFATGG